jgi:general nucleoside transport system permease protein
MQQFWQQLLSTTFLVALLSSTVRLAMPILLAGLGETFAERSGILNIGIEGIMLIGAMAGLIGSRVTGSPWLGLVCGILAGMVMALLHAFLSVTVVADQVVSGLSVNILSLGIAMFTFRSLYGLAGQAVKAPGFDVLPIPVLSQLPVIGPILFRQQALVYLGLLLVPVAYLVLFRTTFGQQVTATGEDPRAAESMGVDALRTRYACVLVGGATAGMAGVFLSLGELRGFSELMVAGRGFIAVAVVMFGRWNPVGALLAALLFGLADAFQLHLQAFSISNIPPQALQALPYLVTVLAVVSGIGRGFIPSALCVPYRREQ